VKFLGGRPLFIGSHSEAPHDNIATTPLFLISLARLLIFNAGLSWQG